MTSPVPNRPATKGKSVLVSAYKIEINTGTAAAPNFTGLFGVRSMSESSDQTLVDNSDWDDVDEATGLIHQSQVATGDSWGLEVTVSAKDYGTTDYQADPGQQYLEDHSGDLVELRWYRRNGAGKVKRGWARVKYAPTDNSGVQNATITFTGDGKLDKSVDASTLVA